MASTGSQRRRHVIPEVSAQRGVWRAVFLRWSCCRESSGLGRRQWSTKECASKTSPRGIATAPPALLRTQYELRCQKASALQSSRSITRKKVELAWSIFYEGGYKLNRLYYSYHSPVVYLNMHHTSIRKNIFHLMDSLMRRYLKKRSKKSPKIDAFKRNITSSCQLAISRLAW